VTAGTLSDDLARAILARRRSGRRKALRGSAAALARPVSTPPSRGATEASAGTFRRVSTRAPCPVCSRDSWCLVARDGGTVLCQRVPSERVKARANGEEYFVHVVDGAARVALASTEAQLAPTTNRAAAEVRDRAFRALLAALDLDTVDRDGLRRRGLPDEDIAADLYRSLPDRQRARLARVVVDAVGEADAAGVPGIVQRADGSRRWWSVAGAPGLVVPVLDLEGRVVALKVRRRDPCDGPRYLYLTSTRDGGASAEPALHVPRLARERLAVPEGVTLAVTGGELKADVASALCSWAVVSVPGVGSWRLAVDLAERLRPARVVIALDMDDDDNPAVARACASLLAALRAGGFAPVRARWPRRFKGLDDFLTAQRAGGTEALS